MPFHRKVHQKFYPKLKIWPTLLVSLMSTKTPYNTYRSRMYLPWVTVHRRRIRKQWPLSVTNSIFIFSYQFLPGQFHATFFCLTISRTLFPFDSFQSWPSWGPSPKHRSLPKRQTIDRNLWRLCIMSACYRLRFMYYGRIRLFAATERNIPLPTRLRTLFDVFDETWHFAANVLEINAEWKLEWTGIRSKMFCTI